ncbi:molybdate ABC transporter substrate-binding protein [Amphritea balenae]|uniref:Molybdate ABC transporter substrate-binding protein n=1 Tax=Amphritea balenae TaxID=452629 RepID=A0A3P1SVI1_9GAMM|nr:molybdate ABC transporter substrate-binding protein [Amphritea balenae]RRD01171.1 molybdate ABC transporter substrate-binding protein [Amphritea balenae]
MKLFITSLCFWLSWASPALYARPLTVFAASSLTNAMNEVAAAYQKESNTKVISSYAASSALARQIASGAPADIYIAANHRWMDYLSEQRSVNNASIKPLLQNSLALIASNFTGTQPVTLKSLPSKLNNDYLAIADPDHVPAGIYTKQALQSLQLWESLKLKLARGQNVRSTLLLVERGETPYGIVYRTDAIQSQHSRIISLIPESLHQPISYPIALVANHQPEALQLYNFLFSPQARAIFTRYGFIMSEEIKADAQ